MFDKIYKFNCKSKLSTILKNTEAHFNYFNQTVQFFYKKDWIHLNLRDIIKLLLTVCETGILNPENLI